MRPLQRSGVDPAVADAVVGGASQLCTADEEGDRLPTRPQSDAVTSRHMTMATPSRVEKRNPERENGGSPGGDSDMEYHLTYDASGIEEQIELSETRAEVAGPQVAAYQLRAVWTRPPLHHVVRG